MSLNHKEQPWNGPNTKPLGTEILWHGNLDNKTNMPYEIPVLAIIKDFLFSKHPLTCRH